MRATCLTVLLLGCSYKHGTLVDEVLEDGSIEDLDAPPADARVDTPAGSVCFGTGLLVDCYPTELVPAGAFVPGGDLDTSNAQTCTKTIPQTNGPELCVRAAATITIGTAVRFSGSRPLVLLATDTITVTAAGTLDVSSFRNDVGAGGNTGTCADGGTGSPNPSNGSKAGAGGGGGGGFGTPGGSGGAGKNVGGGASGGTTSLTQIRGGCRGARGGTSSVGPGGDGGNGGGAVYLIAGTSITIDGTLKANGSGGRGGPNKAGGGGGGSGGLIAFDAPAVTIGGTLIANGGGGGEGGGGGQAGDDGSDPDLYNARASGGGANMNGGDGGGGSAFANAGATGGTDPNGGGGGGGGGAGRIKFYQTDPPTGKLSPPAN